MPCRFAVNLPAVRVELQPSADFGPGPLEIALLGEVAGAHAIGRGECRIELQRFLGCSKPVVAVPPVVIAQARLRDSKEQDLPERKPEAARQMLERSERVLAQDSLNASALGVSAGALAILGDLDRAKERIQRAMDVDPENINVPYNFACVLAAWVGDIEAALDMLEPMMHRQSRSLMLTMLADPDMDPLRDHPRFKSMVAKAMKRTGLTEDMLPDTARSTETPILPES